MTKLFILLFCTIAATCTIAQTPGALTPGAPIPMAETKMKSTTGKFVSIEDVIRKNGVLVVFSCNTCPYVKKYQGRTLEMIKEATGNDIGVIIINSNEELRNSDDSYLAMQQYANQQGYKNAEYVVDTKSALADAFNANRTPECFLFDNKRKLVYHGAIDDNPDAAGMKRKHLSVAINELVTGKEVTIKETRSVGCMIKRS